MALKTGTFFLVVGLAMWSGTVRGEQAKDAATIVDTGTLDKAYPMPANGVEFVAVKEKVGPLVFEEILLNNLPKSQEVEVAVANNTDDKCRPKIAVKISNPTALKMKAKIVTTLEGADGTVYMKCDRNDSVKPFAESDRTNMCFLESIQTRNWPKVKKIHITASVGRDR